MMSRCFVRLSHYVLSMHNAKLHHITWSRYVTCVAILWNGTYHSIISYHIISCQTGPCILYVILNKIRLHHIISCTVWFERHVYINILCCYDILGFRTSHELVVHCIEVCLNQNYQVKSLRSIAYWYHTVRYDIKWRHVKSSIIWITSNHSMSCWKCVIGLFR